ncbi:uncharacterized protein VTP21DRAFT_7703 [Calcarisporiella thermophila]|uniref:uncharacterized protein n=1 Tax=Calcarisporiella thermophila TaxID=911321 RepID=UPI0037441AB4
MLRVRPFWVHHKAFLFKRTLTSHIPQHDTIFALSSAPGKAGIAVIRISGPKALTALKTMTHSSLSPRQALFTRIYNPHTSETLDRGLALWFPGPRSFTGEDVAELHVHGGVAIVRAVLDALGKFEGFRMAERGEFARRAFDNDKLDLTEVEGLVDLINAETEAQRKQALRQAEGSLKTLYEGWRRELIECMALVEAIIDFGEDENIEEGVFEQVSRKVKELFNSLNNHLNDNRRGEILRSGIHVALFGPPNAGKSSILNRLAQREAAIVSPIPGTTRDVVELSLDLGGYPVLVGDTAGLRETRDVIEEEGVRRAKRKIEAADLRVCVLPADEIGDHVPVDAVVRECIDKETVCLVNKIDLLSSNKLALSALKTLPTSKIWPISCVTGEGFPQFLSSFVSLLKDRFDTHAFNTPLITQTRHRKELSECAEALQAFFENEGDVVLAAEELRRGALALGRVTGRVDVEEVLDVIFREFCIGK